MTRLIRGQLRPEAAHLDECASSRRFAARLREFGIIVSTTGDAQLRGASDKKQLQHCCNTNRAIVTTNARDFERLHAEGMPHAGIILIAYGDLETSVESVAHLFWLAVEGIGGPVVDCAVSNERFPRDGSSVWWKRAGRAVIKKLLELAEV